LYQRATVVFKEIFAVYVWGFPRIHFYNSFFPYRSCIFRNFGRRLWLLPFDVSWWIYNTLKLYCNL